MPVTAIVLVFLSATIHAAWNLFAHSQQSITGTLFLRCHIVAGLVILLPELVAEWKGDHFSLLLWGVISISGVIHSIYYAGLIMGYRGGNFTVVYPMSRALPVLFLAGFDIFRGQELSWLGCLGIILIVIGCGLTPLQSLNKVNLSDYWNWSTVWVLVIVLATVAYTAVDKIAVDVFLPPNIAELARYELLQAAFTLPFLWVIFQFIDKFHSQSDTDSTTSLALQSNTSNSSTLSEVAESGVTENTSESLLSRWQSPILLYLFVFGSYWFMLLAYQLSPYVSYLTALRQISVVIGVAIGMFILHEPSQKLRLGAAVLIVLGSICISQVPA